MLHFFFNFSIHSAGVWEWRTGKEAFLVSHLEQKVSILILRGLKKIPIPRRQQRDKNYPFGDPLRGKLPLGRQQTFESPADSPLLITQRGPSNFIEGLTPDIFLEKQVRGRRSDKRSR